MDQLISLRVLNGLVEFGSFSQAASNLGIAVSTASAHIAHLEAHWGVQLLNRSTRALSLTDEGRALHERAKAVLDEFDSLKKEFNGSGQSLIGRLRIAVPPLSASLMLIPEITEFCRRYPGLEMEIHCSTNFTDIVREGMDCAIRAGVLPDSTLIARPLGQFNMGTYASPSYIAKYGEPSDPEHLGQHQCIMWLTPTGNRVRDWLFEKEGSKKTVIPSGRLTFSTPEACVEACAMGMGITQVVSIAAREYLNNGRLKLVLGKWIAPGPPVQIVYPQTRLLNAKTRAFVDYALEVMPRYLLLDETLRARHIEGSAPV